jgi:hypothetical protein
MGEPRAVMVAFIEDEDLGLVLEPSECSGVDDAVTVAAKSAAAFADRLGMEPAAAAIGITRIRSAHRCFPHCGFRGD